MSRAALRSWWLATGPAAALTALLRAAWMAAAQHPWHLVLMAAAAELFLCRRPHEGR
jgi:hypothetical protein